MSFRKTKKRANLPEGTKNDTENEIKMSSSSESQLSSFLSSSYKHPNMTKRDVMGLLHHYNGLTPKEEKFIFNGREIEELHLIGTIPVPYKVRLTLIVARCTHV